MFHELDSDVPDECDAVVPAPVGPRCLGPFRMDSLQFGGTYVASHDRVGAKVTVQVVPPMRREDRDGVIRGINLVQQYRWLEYVQDLLWITQRGDNLLLVSECPEDSLQSLVGRCGPLDPHAVGRVFTQVLVAVAALHADHVVHRNITLQTVLLCGGVAKLSGFDRVNRFDDDALAAQLERSLEYASPELVCGVDVTLFDRTKIDMWALGCVLCALVTGELPFERESRGATADAIRACEVELPRWLDPQCAACVGALLRPDPSARPSAAQLLRSDWLAPHHDAALAWQGVAVPPSAVELKMRALGFPADHVAASRADSAYSLPSAERRLVAGRLRAAAASASDPDEHSVPLIPSDAAATTASCIGSSSNESQNRVHAAVGGAPVAVKRDSGCCMDDDDDVPCAAGDLLADALVPNLDASLAAAKFCRLLHFLSRLGPALPQHRSVGPGASTCKRATDAGSTAAAGALVGHPARGRRHYKSPTSSHASKASLLDIAALRDEVSELRRLTRGASVSRPAAVEPHDVAGGMAELSPALRMLGPAPPNRPSTVTRVPAPKEGRFGGGPNDKYDGLTDAKHLGGSTAIDTMGQVPGLWNWLMKAVTVRTVMDVGCGRGISTRWFMDHGADVLCVEGANDAINKSYLPPDRIVAHDFALGPYWPDKTYDLAWCIEVLEHVARPYMANYQAIFHKSAFIIASHSAWGGHHHVEVHPDWWWITRMEAQGFVYSERLTKLIRAITMATKDRATGTQGQHIYFTAHAYINPKVASLPQHAHLLGLFGCFRGKGQERPCKDEEDMLPDSFLPVHRTPTQWDVIEIGKEHVYVGTGWGAGGQRQKWDMTTVNLENAKCNDDYPAPTVGDGCDNLSDFDHPYRPK